MRKNHFPFVQFLKVETFERGPWWGLSSPTNHQKDENPPKRAGTKERTRILRWLQYLMTDKLCLGHISRSHSSFRTTNRDSGAPWFLNFSEVPKTVLRLASKGLSLFPLNSPPRNCSETLDRKVDSQPGVAGKIEVRLTQSGLMDAHGEMTTQHTCSQKWSEVNQISKPLSVSWHHVFLANLKPKKVLFCGKLRTFFGEFHRFFQLSWPQKPQHPQNPARGPSCVRSWIPSNGTAKRWPLHWRMAPSTCSSMKAQDVSLGGKGPPGEMERICVSKILGTKIDVNAKFLSVLLFPRMFSFIAWEEVISKDQVLFLSVFEVMIHGCPMSSISGCSISSHLWSRWAAGAPQQISSMSSQVRQLQLGETENLLISQWMLANIEREREKSQCI